MVFQCSFLRNKRPKIMDAITNLKNTKLIGPTPVMAILMKVKALPHIAERLIIINQLLGETY